MNNLFKHFLHKTETTSTEAENIYRHNDIECWVQCANDMYKAGKNKEVIISNLQAKGVSINDISIVMDMLKQSIGYNEPKMKVTEASESTSEQDIVNFLDKSFAHTDVVTVTMVKQEIIKSFPSVKSDWAAGMLANVWVDRRRLSKSSTTDVIFTSDDVGLPETEAAQNKEKDITHDIESEQEAHDHYETLASEDSANSSDYHEMAGDEADHKKKLEDMLDEKLGVGKSMDEYENANQITPAQHGRANQIEGIDSDIWDLLNVRSGGELRADPKTWAQYVKLVGQKVSGQVAPQVMSILENDNYHCLTIALQQLGKGPHMWKSMITKASKKASDLKVGDIIAGGVKVLSVKPERITEEEAMGGSTMLYHIKFSDGTSSTFGDHDYIPTEKSISKDREWQNYKLVAASENGKTVYRVVAPNGHVEATCATKEEAESKREEMKTSKSQVQKNEETWYSEKSNSKVVSWVCPSCGAKATVSAVYDEKICPKCGKESPVKKSQVQKKDKYDLDICPKCDEPLEENFDPYIDGSRCPKCGEIYYNKSQVQKAGHDLRSISTHGKYQVIEDAEGFFVVVDENRRVVGGASDLTQGAGFTTRSAAQAWINNNIDKSQVEKADDSNTLRAVNSRKLYTADQIHSKYAGKFIDVYPHHQDYWNDKAHRFETVYEVRGVSSKIRENYEEAEEIGKSQVQKDDSSEARKVAEQMLRSGKTPNMVTNVIADSYLSYNDAQRLVDDIYEELVEQGILKSQVQKVMSTSFPQAYVDPKDRFIIYKDEYHPGQYVVYLDKIGFSDQQFSSLNGARIFAEDKMGLKSKYKSQVQKTVNQKLVDAIWDKMNDSEKLGVKFGMFPAWIQNLNDGKMLEHDDVVALMNKIKTNKSQLSKTIGEFIGKYLK